MPGTKKYHISDADLDVIHTEWQAAGGNDKNAVLQRYAQLIGCSVATIRTRIRKKYGRTKKVSTQKEVSVPEYVIDEAERIVWRCLQFGDRRPTAKVIRRKLIRRGLPEAECPSASTINRRLRARGLWAPRRFRRVEAEFALQRVQLDYSRSEYFQLIKPDGAGDYILRVTQGSFAYKDNNLAKRTWICSLIDDHSRMNFARMYEASGESGMLGLRFLRDFFHAEDNEDAVLERHFIHAPWTLQTDHGPFWKSGAANMALKSLDVELHAASTKEAQGKVERNFRTLWTDFELDLAEDLGRNSTILMSEYNVYLREWCIERGKEAHPTRRGTREQIYLASLRAHEPQTFTGDMLQLAFNQKECTVNSYGHIHWNNVELVMPDFVYDEHGEGIAITPKMKVTVMQNLRGEYLAQLKDRYHPEPLALTVFGEANAPGNYQSSTHTAPAKAPMPLHPTRPGHEHTMLPERPAQPPVPILEPAAQPAKPAAKILTLPHRSTEIKPSSPFTAERTEPVLSGIKARIHVGLSVKPFGMDYTDVEALFEPLIQRGATRAELDALLTQYTKEAV